MRPPGATLWDELCRAFMRDLDAQEVDHLQAWFSAASVVWIPPRPPVRGARRIVALFRAALRGYRDIHWRVTRVHTVGPRQCIYFSESWGTRRSGAPYRNHIVTLVEFDEDGRIASLSDYFKDTAVFTPKGASPERADGTGSTRA